MKFWLCIFTVLAVAGVCFAGQPQVTVIWGYDNPPPDLAGFKLYCNEKLELNIEDPQAREITFTCNNCIDGKNKFELTAYDKAQQESPKSNPAFSIWDAPPNNAPSILKIELIHIRNGQ